MVETAQTQTRTAPASSGDDSSSSSNSNAGSESPQTVTPKVDTGSAEGKSASSDGKDGAASDGERHRPGQAERRISELSSKIKTLEAEIAQKDNLTDTLQGAPVDQSKIEFPDYSKMSEVSPDQLKADLIKTAEQIVDQKMATAGTALQEGLSQKQAIEKSTEAIEATISRYSVLDPQSDEYDQDLDHEITEAYAAVLQKDPGYSFTKFIKPFTRILEPSDTTSKDASKTESRGRAANRATTPVRRANEFPENGTTEQMEKWFAENRG